MSFASSLTYLWNGEGCIAGFVHGYGVWNQGRLFERYNYEVLKTMILMNQPMSTSLDNE